MNYIIDANNLAGKLGLLDQNDFDKKLIEILRLYFFRKEIRIILVFDSHDPMGDKFIIDNIEVIYTPSDNYYKSADDKIAEIIRQKPKQMIIVTDDIELVERIEKVEREEKIIVKKMKATVFAEKINEKINFSEDEQLSEEVQLKINKELLDIWK